MEYKGLDWMFVAENGD